jgi:hypothetical protein
VNRVNRKGLFLAITAAAASLACTVPAWAAGDDVRARCDGNTPVILSRPPGTEYIAVTCVDGLPEYTVSPTPVPTYDPVRQALPQVIPPDFGAWVTVWLNGHPLKTPYNPVRKVQEPGAWLAAATGRVMMPIRFFTEAFSGQVQWFQDERRVHLALPAKGVAIDVWADRTFAQVNGRWVTLDQSPVIFADRLFVPVRFLGEAVGAGVNWDRSNRSVRVQLDGASCSSTIYCGEVR